MADYVFKVQVLLPGNVLETVILRQYVDPVDRCFDKFKTNLVQRYDVLTNTPFKMMWIDNDGDKISIFNEEDLRTFMELKGTKVFVEVDDASNASEKKPAEKSQTSVRTPLLRSCRRSGSERGWILGDGRYRAHNGPEINGNNIYPPAGTSPHLLLHSGVQCDGCDAEIRGYRYKCIECPDYDLCFSCEMKKIHGDHMMIRIVKPLDRPFNRHFLKAMMKQRCLFRESCEGKDKDKKPRHRHGDAAYNVIDDLVTNFAKNMNMHCTNSPSNETNNAEQNKENKSNVNDAQQFALNADTFAKAGSVLSNLAQHFASVMDPFAVHEFIPTTQTNSTEPKTNDSQPKEKKVDEQPNFTDEKQNDASDLPSNPMPTTAAIPRSVAVVSPDQQVTIEDLIELPSAPRDSSPVQDWALVDADGHVEGDQPKHTGAIPKSSAVQTPSSVGSVDVAQALPNYAILARDLENHLHNTLKSQASQTPPQMPIVTPVQMPIVHHPNPRINEAIITMTSMGFSNGGGWLTRLLENVDGDIPKALEKLHPSQ